MVRRIKRYEPRKDKSCDDCGQREGESIEIKRLFVFEEVHHFVCEQTNFPVKGLEISSDVIAAPSISQQNGDPLWREHTLCFSRIYSFLSRHLG